ncbi:hypothetical protein FVR03_21800 [Pontibacter qinzhouensis]|uniref:Lipoprotein n=1 Tax=Pontibacter qinzhouensis TaxID=2603253 RepID=A0A5C8IZD4_9BACT|nr:hypothetical protein [Pontibacter qinzhouensis]TXK26424.1 hypothetical protein FVR03_21800 [Pontibacter qinzhouensis]
MHTKNIKAVVMAGAICAFSGFGLAACNTGTDAGDTNVERSGIRETEETAKQSRTSRDTADYEHHYDHADHPDSVALGDGAYNQDGKRDKRGE